MMLSLPVFVFVLAVVAVDALGWSQGQSYVAVLVFKLTLELVAASQGREDL